MTQQPAPQPMFRSLAISASGLSAQRVRMETIASNIANAETTRGPDGQPYRRRVTTMAAGDGTNAPMAANVAAPGMPFGDVAQSFQVPVLETNGSGAPATTGVHVASVTEDQTEGPLVYDPGHPDANKQGYVRYPNVRITDEIVDMMDSRRVYEANATVFQSAKSMLRKALDI
jgi:flagellar basal-body rod protein FlgC